MKFSRGDVTGDTSINIANAAILVQNIFFNRIVRFDCQDMMNVDDDGQLSATDPIVILPWMFLGPKHRTVSGLRHRPVNGLSRVLAKQLRDLRSGRCHSW